MKKNLVVNVDGASSGNPGPAGVGFLIMESCQGKNTVVRRVSAGIGRATNNVAEYVAVIYALIECLILGGTDVEVITDSELVARQINGQYKVKDAQLKILNEQVRYCLKKFGTAGVRNVPREENSEADKLANKAISP